MAYLGEHTVGVLRPVSTADLVAESFEEERASVLWHGAFLNRPRQRSTLDGVLAGTVSPSEPMVTGFMCNLGGEIEQSLIRLLCSETTVTPRTTFRIISGTDYNQRTGNRDRRSIDLVIIDTAAGDAAQLIVEAKFTAQINGRLGYCPLPQNAGRYSNQFVCYAHGCIHPTFGDAQDGGVPRVWLGPARGDGLMPWRGGGVSVADRSDRDFAYFVRAVDATAPSWIPLTWNVVWDHLEGALITLASEQRLSSGVASSVMRALGAPRARPRVEGHQGIGP